MNVVNVGECCGLNTLKTVNGKAGYKSCDLKCALNCSLSCRRSCKENCVDSDLAINFLVVSL